MFARIFINYPNRNGFEVFFRLPSTRLRAENALDVFTLTVMLTSFDGLLKPKHSRNSA